MAESTPMILSADWQNYELIDSGNRLKLERFGAYTLIRGEPKAWWKPDTGKEQWGRAQAIFHDSGRWEFPTRINRQWAMDLHGLRLQARITDNSKHLGVFPEQYPHWRWMADRLGRKAQPRLLNLFGYTGVASLVAAQAGASVTHVDASKPSISWGRENQALSSMAEKPIRWILDDAVKYARREINRKNQYDAIILDPPSFGRGPNKELWKVEEQLGELLSLCRQLLSEKPLFLILTLYNLEASPLMIENLLGDVLSGLGGRIDYGELALKHRYSSKRLPLSLFGRWEAPGSID